MKRAILFAACLLAFVATAHAQPRAPAGGMYVGGKFYKGGQFIPNSAGGLGMSGAGGGDFYLGPMPASRPYQPKTTARRLARVKARTSARTTASAGRTNIATDVPSGTFMSSQTLANYAKRQAYFTPRSNSLADQADAIEAALGFPPYGMESQSFQNQFGAEGPQQEVTEATEPRSDAATAIEIPPRPIAIAENRIRMAKNLIAIDKKPQAKEWLDLVVQMNASPGTVKEAENLLASIAK